MGRDENGEINRYQALKNFVVHDMERLHFSKVNEMLLKSFKQESGMIRFKLLKDVF